MSAINEINDYIKGNLSEEQLDNYTRKMVKDIFEEEQHKEKWSQLLSKDPEWNAFAKSQVKTTTSPPISQSKPRIRAFRWMAIAASFLLLVLGATYYFSTSQRTYLSLASAQLKEAFPYDTSRGGADTEDLRSQAGAYYSAGNYEAAITVFSQILQEGTATEEAAFYLGLSHLYTKNYEQAIPFFLRVKEASTNELQREATWFLGLAHLENGQAAQAKIYLQEIATTQGWKSKEAQTLIDAL